MTPRRTAPILRDETEGIKSGNDHNTGELVRTATGTVDRQRNLIGAIKHVFREAMRCLTRRAPAPEAQPMRRRKTGGVASAFRLAARKVIARILRGPVIDLYTPEFWQWNNPDFSSETTEEFHHTEPNHLSLRL
jgi:hypothetical protein